MQHPISFPFKYLRLTKFNRLNLSIDRIKIGTGITNRNRGFRSRCEM